MSSYLFLGFGRDVAKDPWYVTPCSAALAAITSLVVMENGTGSTEGRIAIVRWADRPGIDNVVSALRCSLRELQRLVR